MTPESLRRSPRKSLARDTDEGTSSASPRRSSRKTISAYASQKKRRPEQATSSTRKKREDDRIAEIMKSPSKKRGSMKRLAAGRQVKETVVKDPEDSEDDIEDDVSTLSGSSTESEDDEDEANEYSRPTRSRKVDDESASENASSADDNSVFDSDEDNSSDEDTAVTSDEDYSDDESDGGKRRRSKVKSTWTPRKQTRTEDALGTPRTPRAYIINTITSTPHLPTRSLNITTMTTTELENLTPQARAKKLLHVGATPETLPCREDQYEEVLACVEDAIQDGIGGCVYVSGVPGVGKTATIREAIRSLIHRAQEGLLSPFNFVEINGMKLNDAQDAYGLLWQTLSGMRCSNKSALRSLGHHFSRGGAGISKDTTTTVVLMDELDQLITTRQEVMYNMFNWPNSKNSRLIVVAVANTMDLPERILNPKVASRLGMTRITFKPYNDKQLVEIVNSRLGVGLRKADLDGKSEVERCLIRDCDEVFEQGAIIYVSKRVSNVSGDARRMLDVCRRAIESVELKTKKGKKIRKVTIDDVMKVFDSMVKSGKVSHIIRLSLHAKIIIISILACSRRSGVVEIDLGAIVAHSRTLCRMQAIESTVDLQNVSQIMAQLSSLGLLIAVGNGAGNARGGIHARFLLACQEDEIRLALEQDQDARLRRML